MRARADLRRRMASVIVLTVLTGVVGAVAMTAFSTARRTDTAYARFREATNEPDVVTAGCDNGLFPPIDFDRVDRLEGVERSVPYWLANPVGSYQEDGEAWLYPVDEFAAALLAPTGPENPVALRMVEGRLPQGTEEVALAWAAPGYAQAGVGDEIVIRMISARATVEDLFADEPPPPDAFIEVRAEVVGVFLGPNGLGGGDNTILASTAFYERHGEEVFSCTARAITLTDRLDGIPRFGASLSAITPGAFFFDMSTEQINAERATHLRAIVMRLFGWLTVLTGLLIVGQALVRRTVQGATDDPILRALGMSRWQVASIPVMSSAMVATGGASIAVIGSIAASSFTLTGLAKMMEPDPGAWVDLPVLVTGALTIALVVVGLTLVPAWRLAGAPAGIGGAVEISRGRPSRIASAAASIGLPPTATAGARLALEPGHGRTATPVRSAVVAIALSVMAMVAAFGFASSMSHFIATPRLWGADFELATGNPFTGNLFEEQAVPFLREDPGLVDVTVGNFQTTGYLTASDATVAAAIWALSGTEGPPLTPTMLAGRWPEADDEIALGSSTIRRLGLEIGEQVRLDSAGTGRMVTVVGIPVFPDFGFGAGFGDGAGMTLEGLQALDPSVTQNLLFANYAPGVDREEVISRINPTLREMEAEVSDPLMANTLGEANRDAQRARNVPLALASLFTVVALATLIHVLITSVRRRRRDLAILRTVGFTRRQIAVTVAWQAATIAVLAVAIGVPLGALLGRLAWSLFADQLGVVSVPIVGWVQILLLIPVTIAAAVVISIGPAMAARRTKPAVVLRAE